MNKRAISAVLSKVHAKFCESITDETVRELVKKNSIITGGSIASMLLGEPVNDYDYYFTDRETVVAVAQYYVNQFVEAHPEQRIKPIVHELEDGRVKIKIQSVGIASDHKDDMYQYFEQHPDEAGEDYVESVMEAVEDAKEKPKHRAIFMSSNAITLSGKIQLVIRFYGDAETIHRNYDFVHCTSYWTSSDQKLTIYQAALESLMCKQLFYQGSLYPLCSVIRTRKFIKRGWHINAGQFLKMCFQISELDLSHLPTLEDQLTGVDAAYFRQVIEYCQKKQEEEPEFKVTAPYLIAVIDRIFG